MIATILNRGLAALLLAVTLVPAASAQQPADGEGPTVTTASPAEKIAVVRQAIDGYIKPGYAALEESAGREAAALDELCETPSDAKLEAVRDAFADLAKAWSRIEFVQFGPVMEDNRTARILFFPDRRGIALRQVQGILAKKEEDVVSADGLAGKSVAVQGLGALEFALYGDGADALSGPDADFRCRYASAIAGNVKTLAGQIAEGWGAPDGISRRLTDPQPSDTAYRNADDSLKEIAEIFIHGFEAIRDLRLTPAMGENPEKARPTLFLFHRADLTLASLRANYAGMSDLFETSGITALLPASRAFLKNAIAFEFENADLTLGKLKPPISKVAVSPKDRQGLTYLLIVTDSLQKQFAGQLAPALALSAGFSSLDGD